MPEAHSARDTEKGNRSSHTRGDGFSIAVGIAASQYRANLCSRSEMDGDSDDALLRARSANTHLTKWTGEVEPSGDESSMTEKRADSFFRNLSNPASASFSIVVLESHGPVHPGFRRQLPRAERQSRYLLRMKDFHAGLRSYW